MKESKTKGIDPGTCQIKTIHKEVVDRVAQGIPSIEEMQSVSSFFKLFADQSRLAIIWVLSEAEMCVCDICAALGMKQSAVSHQLNKLKLLRVVKSRREGKVVYYSLDDSHVKFILSMGFEHITEEA
jgi:ArsR family transcriptional regulator